jgi:nicotinamidase-related amidase
VARREVRSTGDARGGVGRAVPWPEVSVCMEALLGGNGGAGWLAVGSEQRTTVRGGAWRQWEAHRLRGGPGWWLVEAVVDEVAIEEMAMEEPTRTRSNAVRAFGYAVTVTDKRGPANFRISNNFHSSEL